MRAGLINKFDKLSNEIIKDSTIGKLLGFCRTSVISILGRDKPCPYSYITLLILIGVLFISLSLPQFANDRFGIGLIIIFCFIIFLLDFFTNKNISISFNSIDLLVMVFCMLSIISTFSSYFFKESSIGLLKYIAFFLFYFMIKTISLNSSKKTFLNLWWVLYICAVLVAIIGIYQYSIGIEPLATWEDPSFNSLHTRAYSTLGNPNLLAGYLLIILPVGIILPFATKANLILKLLSILASFLISICLIFTGSRGGYLALAAQIIISIIIFLNFFIVRKGLINQTPIKIFLLLTITILFLIGLVYLFPLVKERLSTIFTIREYSSNNHRVNVWLACLKMLKDNFILGIGPGNSTFRLAYGLYMISGFDALAAYNIFLELALETGVLGYLTIIFIFIISFLKLHYLFWVKNEIFALGIFISLIGVLVHGMVDTILFRPQVFVPFWFLLASIARLEDRKVKE